MKGFDFELQLEHLKIIYHLISVTLQILQTIKDWAYFNVKMTKTTFSPKKRNPF